MINEAFENLILVTGATGRQGGAVARHLLRDGWRVRAMTRDPDKPAGRELSLLGAEVVRGDLDDRRSLDECLRGVYGVFSVQNWREVGLAGEVRQGKELANAAAEADVQHFVYSSVGGAERNTHIPHFDSKYEIEQHIRSLSLPSTILRPVFFMENFSTPETRAAALNGMLSLPLPATTSLQMIAVDDIGALAAIAFKNERMFLGKAMEIAGDEMTLSYAAVIFSGVIGRTVRYVESPLDRLRQQSAETARMFEWLIQDGYHADIAMLRSLHPEMLTLERWLQRTGWAQAEQEQLSRGQQ